MCLNRLLLLLFKCIVKVEGSIKVNPHCNFEQCKSRKTVIYHSSANFTMCYPHLFAGVVYSLMQCPITVFFLAERRILTSSYIFPVLL